MSTEEKLASLKNRLRVVSDLRSAAHLLQWDESTYMPPRGAAARGRQLATLRTLAHEHFTALDTGKLLDAVEPLATELPYASDDASLIRVTRKDFDKATRMPGSFLEKMQTHLSESYHLWTEARPADDFAKVSDTLERTLDLSREYAGFFEYDHVADPLIDTSDEGMTVATLRPLFIELRRDLVPLVEQITAQTEADDSVLKQHFAEDKQLEIGLAFARAFGYDLSRGRLDQTPHPFATSFSVNDVRITTRVKERDLSEGLFSTLHEAGHALYEQGVSESLEATPLARGTSSGVHESQSRLWENLVGRSRGFLDYAYPRLQTQFPEQLGQIPVETFYRAVNKVSRSLIRTDADEVTYNLHVIIRFDLELELLTDKLAVKELPEAWRERYRSDLGVTPETDRDGVLQDVHWFAGTVGGAFQGYTLGNLLSSQFYEAALKAHPDIPEQITQGKFDTLHAWLRETIYQHGRKLTAPEIIEQATGRAMTAEPYFRHLKTKFGELYELEEQSKI